MKQKNDFHLLQLAQFVYDNEKISPPNNYQSIDKKMNNRTGFYAETFKKENNIVIVFKGSDTISDYFTDDMSLMNKRLPYQFFDAVDYVKKIQRNFRHHDIQLVGHSLGGSLGQLTGSTLGINTITFNAYGTGDILNQIPNQDTHIKNYGNIKDPVFIAKLDKHIGETYVIGDFNTDITTKKQSINIKNIHPKYHYLSEIGDLSTAVKYEPNVEKGTNIVKGNISYEYYLDEIFDIKNRVLHRNEIDIETADKELIDLYADQLLDDYFPEKGELDMRVFAGDLIYVNSYQKQDGTEVSGYYRRRPAK